MEIWPIFLLAAGLVAFLVYLFVVVNRLFFIKKRSNYIWYSKFIIH